jgi:uncharacterized protein (TIGR02145 family)
MRKLILVLIVLCFFCSGCSKDEEGPAQGNVTCFIKGKITTAGNGDPIIGVSIHTNPATATVTTDVAGKYIISGVTAGSYTVIASKEGYLANSTNISVTGGNTATADILLSTTAVMPLKPTLLLPANNFVNETLSPTLSWNSSQEATEYHLQVSENNLFTSNVADFGALQNTSQKIFGLQPAKQYWWRVTAINNSGSSEPSDSWSFTTGNFSQDQSCPGLPTVVHEGKTYNTVQIGNQCWLKENINAGSMILRDQSPGDNSIIEKYCYNNDTANCNFYGGIYSFGEALAYKMTPKAKGICPTGFHIPTLEEWQVLEAMIGNNSNQLKALGQGIEEGTGTNTTGFSALLGGYIENDNHFYGIGFNTYFLSSSFVVVGYYNNKPYTFSLYSSGTEISIKLGYVGGSVRCIKD